MNVEKIEIILSHNYLVFLQNVVKWGMSSESIFKFENNATSPIQLTNGINCSSCGSSTYFYSLSRWLHMCFMIICLHHYKKGIITTVQTLVSLFVQIKNQENQFLCFVLFFAFFFGISNIYTLKTKWCWIYLLFLKLYYCCVNV